MTFDWRSLSAEQMEQQFNPRVAVADAQARLDVYAARSAAARESIPGEYDLRFGEGEKETLDLHRPAGRTERVPLLLFVHGGYWRALDKSDHSFVVPPLLDAGVAVANINYDLCPTVTLDTMVEQMARALAFCQRNAADWGADPDHLQHTLEWRHDAARKTLYQHAGPVLVAMLPRKPGLVTPGFTAIASAYALCRPSQVELST